MPKLPALQKGTAKERVRWIRVRVTRAPGGWIRVRVRLLSPGGWIRVRVTRAPPFSSSPLCFPPSFALLPLPS